MKDNKGTFKDYMVWNSFINCLGQCMSFSAIYAMIADVLKTRQYATFCSAENIAICLGGIFTSFLWKTHGEKLWKHYKAIIIAEFISSVIVLSIALITDNAIATMVTQDFMLLSVTNMMNGGNEIFKRKRYPSIEMGNSYGQCCQIVNNIGVLLGSGLSILLISLGTPFKVYGVIFSIANIADNIATLKALSEMEE